MNRHKILLTLVILSNLFVSCTLIKTKNILYDPSDLSFGNRKIYHKTGKFLRD